MSEQPRVFTCEKCEATVPVGKGAELGWLYVAVPRDHTFLVSVGVEQVTQSPSAPGGFFCPVCLKAIRDRILFLDAAKTASYELDDLCGDTSPSEWIDEIRALRERVKELDALSIKQANLTAHNSRYILDLKKQLRELAEAAVADNEFEERCEAGHGLLADLAATQEDEALIECVWCTEHGDGPKGMHPENQMHATAYDPDLCGRVCKACYATGDAEGMGAVARLDDRKFPTAGGAQ